ncbi:epidermis-specific secreted glycoprotein EP1 isoform X2 [Spinacia oleracea]|uniref:Epidermis-specific secreted glycoprotein EP1 isoform X2 n=1 Tax=Spinacia oleracea TaxID=3562 RepID=A0ABM3QGM7_SPIOL|nr:epidermis-specific secreted glycoprotein EP1-like isoform X2 [Spinacia oleracea]
MCFLSTSSLLSILCIILLISLSQAQVPPSSTFKHVNQGDFGDYIVEYDGNYRALDIFSSPFQLCFYNTTPNAYTLSLRMGLVRSESVFRWVWEANRGNPVGENATFSLGKDGNLVLADADGRMAWQSNTTNKGVVGFKLLPNGNMVLHDDKVIVMETAKKALQFPGLDEENSAGVKGEFFFSDYSMPEVIGYDRLKKIKVIFLHFRIKQEYGSEKFCR